METVSTGVDILRAHSGHASTNALDRTKTRTSITTDLAIPTAGCISTCKEGDEGDENWRELHDCLWGIWCCVGVGVDVCVCVGVGVSLGFVWRDVLYKLANSSSTFPDLPQTPGIYTYYFWISIYNLQSLLAYPARHLFTQPANQHSIYIEKAFKVRKRYNGTDARKPEMDLSSCAVSDDYLFWFIKRVWAGLLVIYLHSGRGALHIRLANSC